MDKAKNIQRAAKGTLMRAITIGKDLVDAKCPLNELMDAFQVVKEAL